MSSSSSTGTRKPRNVEARAGGSIIKLDKELTNQLKIFTELSNHVGGLVGGAVNKWPDSSKKNTA